ncbi:MAG: L(+)-tartrate dehydratase subunit beta [Treponema sp.]|nr:L(+)-tartrate dehydratase subunit beta [Treponema sp.]
MTEKNLFTPIHSTDLAGLRIGDIVYLNGTLVTGRDDVYQRIVRQGNSLPVDLAGLAVFHAGPLVRNIEGGGAQPCAPQGGDFPPYSNWEMISIGPTTSMRMESCQSEFLQTTGAKLIVGKGGMGEKTAEACYRFGAIHTVFPGGCAVLAAAQVEAVIAAHWLDLGMAEAMWVLRVKDFGPLIVSIDTMGNNLFEDNKRLFEKRKKAALEKLSTG